MFGVRVQLPTEPVVKRVYVAKTQPQPQPSEKLGDQCVRMRTYSKIQPCKWKTYSRPPQTRTLATEYVDDDQIQETNTETRCEEDGPPCPFLNSHSIPPCPFLPNQLDKITDPQAIKMKKLKLANKIEAAVEEFIKTWEKSKSITIDLRRQPNDQIVKTPHVKKARLETMNNDLFQRPSRAPHLDRRFLQPFERKLNRVILKTVTEPGSEDDLLLEQNETTISNLDLYSDEPIFKMEQDTDPLFEECTDLNEVFETSDLFEMDFTGVKTEPTFSETNELSRSTNTTHKTVDNQSKSDLNLSGLHGNRLVDIHKVLNWAFELGKHSAKCGNITLNQEIRDGFRSTFVFNCDKCNNIFKDTNGDMRENLESALADVYSFLDNDTMDNMVIKCEDNDTVINEWENPLDDDAKPIL